MSYDDTRASAEHRTEPRDGPEGECRAAGWLHGDAPTVTDSCHPQNPQRRQGRPSGPPPRSPGQAMAGPTPGTSKTVPCREKARTDLDEVQLGFGGLWAGETCPAHLQPSQGYGQVITLEQGFTLKNFQTYRTGETTVQ